MGIGLISAFLEPCLWPACTRAGAPLKKAAATLERARRLVSSDHRPLVPPPGWRRQARPCNWTPTPAFSSPSLTPNASKKQAEDLLLSAAAETSLRRVVGLQSCSQKLVKMCCCGSGCFFPGQNPQSARDTQQVALQAGGCHL